MSKVEIAIDAVGNVTIAVEGNDISSAVRGFTVTSRVGSLSQLRLDILAEATFLTGEMDVRMPDAVYALLCKAGWTPPASGERIELPAEPSGEGAAEPVPAKEVTA